MKQNPKVVPYTETTQQGPAYWQVGILWVVLATGEQTGGAYSLMWELCPKDSGPGPHYHDQDEQFYVIDGEITFLAGSKEFKAGPGSFILIPRGTVHAFRIDTEDGDPFELVHPGGLRADDYRACRTCSGQGDSAARPTHDVRR